METSRNGTNEEHQRRVGAHPCPRGLHHDHLDGSIAIADIITELYHLERKPFPFPSTDAWVTFFRDENIDIVERFDTVTSVLQNQEAITLACDAYAARRAREGNVYVETKLAPQYHTRGGLSLEQATDAFVNGLAAAERRHHIRLVPSVCIGREISADEGIKIARLVCAYDGEAILDLACDEAGHPPEKHRQAYALTFGTNVKRDCHAGEWVALGPNYNERLAQNVWTALRELRCDSIGHGIPIGNSPELLAYVRDHGVRVTGCPVSYRIAGFINDLRDLRIDRLLDEGICYTLNADDDLFLPGLPAVVNECCDAYHFTTEQARALEENVFRGALGREPERYAHTPNEPHPFSTTHA